MSSRQVPPLEPSRGDGSGESLNVMLFSGFFAVEYFEHLYCRYRNTGTGAEDCGNTGFVKEVVILSGYHTAGSDHDVFTAKLLKLLDNLRYEGLVACGERRHTENMDVVLHSHTGCFGRSLEERSHIDVEAAVGIAGPSWQS